MKTMFKTYGWSGVIGGWSPVLANGVGAVEVNDGAKSTNEQKSGVDLLRSGGGNANITIDHDSNSTTEHGNGNSQIIELQGKGIEGLEDETNGGSRDTHQPNWGVAGTNEAVQEDSGARQDGKRW